MGTRELFLSGPGILQTIIEDHRQTSSEEIRFRKKFGE
jgi:hypothetical protein